MDIGSMSLILLLAREVITEKSSSIISGKAMDEVEHLRHTDVNRVLYRKCQGTIERLIADAKEKHGMCWNR